MSLRIAFCLIAHKNPEQVARLIERIYSRSDYFYINGPSDDRWAAALREYHDGNTLFAPSRSETSWGSFGLVEATLDGMNHFRSLDYDYFVNLTGQCYPIKSVNVMREELGKKNVAYMEYFKLPSSRWEKENGGLDRIRYYHIRLGESRSVRWIRIPRLNRTLPHGLEPYGGSHYFCLPKRFVNYVQEYVSNHPEIVRFYRHCRIPDEMFFQTIIMNSPLRSDVVNDDRMFLVWKGKRNPEILREKDFEEMVRSDKLFARKFDINIDERILDLVDERIHGLN